MTPRQKLRELEQHTENLEDAWIALNQALVREGLHLQQHEESVITDMRNFKEGYEEGFRVASVRAAKRLEDILWDYTKEVSPMLARRAQALLEQHADTKGESDGK